MVDIATIVIVVVITAIIVHFVSVLLKRVLMHNTGVLPSSSIFLNITRAVIWILAVCIVLATCFNVDVSALIAALGVGGIALSLGFQDTIANLVGGLQVSLTKLIQPGDVIKVGADEGTVTDVTWRHVTLRNAEGNTVIIPNAVVNKAALVRLNPPEEKTS
ncbi:MAG: mechanosensitive ion channel family protein [Eggerthellaceae bacterium]|nr:mechanosensitive ion channel family protein [Eggerthellaceae bacterium]